MRKIIMVTGGQRSGKSEFAESLAFRFSSRPVYIATAKVFDDEMAERVKIHKQRREDRWETIEEPLHVGALSERLGEKTVLLDCLTMLATNAFFECDQNVNSSFELIRNELGKFLSGQDTVYVLVTNEIGMGGVSANELQRAFCDLQGMVNRFAASLSDEVYLLVSGIPVKIK